MIYAPNDMIEVDDALDPFSKSNADILLVRVPARAARITAQQGLFSLHKNPVANWDPRQSPDIVKLYDHIDVPANEKAFFTQTLHLFGITHARMMGGLDGVCDTLAVQYRNR